MEIINLDFVKVWANLDLVQITLLSLSIIFLLAQGIFAYSCDAIRSRIIKIWIFETHLPPKFKYRDKKQKYIHLFLIIMFVCCFVSFGFYSAIKQSELKTNNPINFTPASSDTNSLAGLILRKYSQQICAGY
jgi:hypothetical protein